MNPAPCTLNPAPCTLNLEPSAFNPQPSTLDPEPQTHTPHPKPEPLNFQQAGLYPSAAEAFKAMWAKGCAAFERRGNNFKGFKDLYLKSKAIIWP